MRRCKVVEQKDTLVIKFDKVGNSSKIRAPEEVETLLTCTHERSTVLHMQTASFVRFFPLISKTFEEFNSYTRAALVT